MNILFFIESLAKHRHAIYSDDLLMAEHTRRGHKVWAAEPKDLIWKNNHLLVHGNRFQWTPTESSFAESKTIPLSEVRLIYYRAMPPVEGDVMLATLLLAKCDVPFCTPPSAIRNLNEKIMALEFSDYAPPTIITTQRNDLLEFGTLHGWPLILKPLDSYQAIGIEKIMSEKDLPPLRRLTMVQPFLKAVETIGSTRIYLINGKSVGAITFFAKPGDFRTNYLEIAEHQKATISPQQAAACHDIGDFLTKNHVRFAAIDFIGDFLMEINITCPGGLTEYNNEYRTSLEKDIVDAIID